jgi:hypothetical protein
MLLEESIKATLNEESTTSQAPLAVIRKVKAMTQKTTISEL